MARDEEHDASKQTWIQDTHAARQNAMDVRREIPAEMMHTPAWDVPELIDYYNRLLHEYAGQLRPKFNEDHGLWGTELTSVPVPESGQTVDMGSTDHRGEIDISNALALADMTQKPVSLYSLREEWQQNNTTRVTVRMIDPWDGEKTEAIQKSLYLPVSAGDLVLDQLNQCLDELGWLPSQEIGEYQAGQDEVLRHT